MDRKTERDDRAGGSKAWRGTVLCLITKNKKPGIMFGRGAVWWVHAKAALAAEVPATFRAMGGELRG